MALCLHNGLSLMSCVKPINIKVTVVTNKLNFWTEFRAKDKTVNFFEILFFLLVFNLYSVKV